VPGLPAFGPAALRWGTGQQSADDGEAGAADAVGGEVVVADAVEADGQAGAGNGG
jgi:hypothetical protein